MRDGICEVCACTCSLSGKGVFGSHKVDCRKRLAGMPTASRCWTHDEVILAPKPVAVARVTR